MKCDNCGHEQYDHPRDRCWADQGTNGECDCPGFAPPADPKCERCGATLGMYDSLDTVRDCPCPGYREPAESEGIPR